MKTQTGMRLLASLLAMVIAYAIGHKVFLEVPFTTDENSYVFQAHNFLEGKIARPAPPFKEYFFYPMIVCDAKLGWFSRYAPMHPLWLAPGVWIGDPRIMTALAAGLSVWLLTACAGMAAVPAGVMIGLLLFSPYFLFMHATLLSHTSGLLAMCFLIWAYWRWNQTGRWPYAALAGIGWSLLLLNRTYIAVLIAAPFGLDALGHYWRHRSRTIFLGVLAFGLCAGAGVGMYLYYNYLTTGHPLQTAYDFYAPGETLGFGSRVRQDGRPFVHSLPIGLGYLWANVTLLNRWLWGFPGSLLLAAGLWFAGWSRRWSPLFLGALACVWLGHVAFWGPGVNNIGPYYYFETIPFLLLPCAVGITRAWQWLRSRPMGWRAVALLLVVAALAASVDFMWREGRRLRMQQQTTHRLSEIIRAAPAPAIIEIGVAWLDKVDLLTFNPHGLESQPLVVRPVDKNPEPVLRYFAQRQAWRLAGDGSRGLEPFPRRVLDVTFSAPASHHSTGRDALLPDGQNVRLAEEKQDAAGMLAFGNYCYVYPGRFVVEAELETHNVAPETPVWVDVAADLGRAILTRQVVSGTQTNTVRLDFSTDRFDPVEPRVYYGGSGRVAVKTLRVMERDAGPARKE